VDQSRIIGRIKRDVATIDPKRSGWVDHCYFTGPVDLSTGRWGLTRRARARRASAPGPPSYVAEAQRSSSPVMYASSRARPRSSGRCTGGDFIR
jgi:hypothetical protein